MKVTIYTDGACRNNQVANKRIGAWASTIQVNEGDIMYLGECYNGVTNNQMELLAIENALKALGDISNATINIHSDSTYALNSVETVLETKANNWVNKSKNTPANIDILKDIALVVERLSKTNTLTYNKVKGHSNCIGNNIVDAICNCLIDTYSVGKLEDAFKSNKYLSNTTLVKYKEVTKGNKCANGKYIKYNSQMISVSDAYFSKVDKLYKVYNNNTRAQVLKALFLDIVKEVQFLNVVPEIISMYDIIRIARKEINIHQALAFLALFAKENVLGKTASLKDFISTVKTYKVYLGIGMTECITRVSTEKFTGKEMQKITFSNNNILLTKAEILQLHKEMMYSEDYKSAISKIK